MKQFLIAMIVLTGTGIAFLPGNSWGEDLIVNGGFETIGADSTPAGWEFNKQRGTKADIGADDTMAHSGAYSYKIDIAPPGGRVMIYPEKGAIKKPRPGQTYNLSLWVNAKNLDYNQFFVAPAVRLNFQPTRVRPVPTIDLMAYLRDKKGWNELNLKITAPEGAESINLDIVLTKGTIWIDDISLTAVEE